MAGFETDCEGDNHTSSSYNGARYPTSESHLNPTRSNQTSEYAYNMHVNQSIAPRRQATQSSVNVEPLQQDQQHHAYYHAQQRQHYTQQRTPDAVEHDSDKIPYYSSPLMDQQGATHFPGFEDKSSQQYSSHPHSQQMRMRTESNNALPIQPVDADDHAYGYTDKGGMMTRKKNDKSKGNAAATVAPAGGEGVSSIVRGYGTPHQIAYLSVVLLQTLATAAMIAIVWTKIRAGTPRGSFLSSRSK